MRLLRLIECKFSCDCRVDLLRNIRTQVLVKLIKPYTRIAITFISNELNIEPAEVESLLVSCILDR